MTLSTLLLALVAQMNGQVNYNWHGKPSAMLWKDQLFAGVLSRTNAPWTGLFRGTFEPNRKGIRAPGEYWNPISALVHSTNLSKLDIRHDRLLVSSIGAGHYIFPLKTVPGLEATAFGEELCRLHGFTTQSALSAHYWGATYWLLYPNRRKPDVEPPQIPIVPRGFGPPDEDPKADYWYMAGEYSTKARTDVQIAGDKSVRLFHAYKDKLFISIEPDCLNHWYRGKDGDERKDLPPPPNRELRTGKLPKEFTEYFTAYRSGGRDYLVTGSGRVYMAAPKGKIEVVVEQVWSVPTQKIVGVIQDQENDAVYGWGVIGEPGTSQRFYVKFDPKPKAVLYKPTVPNWNDFTDAYLESYECARAFRAAEQKK